MRPIDFGVSSALRPDGLLPLRPLGAGGLTLFFKRRGGARSNVLAPCAACWQEKLLYYYYCILYTERGRLPFRLARETMELQASCCNIMAFAVQPSFNAIFPVRCVCVSTSNVPSNLLRFELLAACRSRRVRQVPYFFPGGDFSHIRDSIVWYRRVVAAFFTRIQLKTLHIRFVGDFACRPLQAAAVSRHHTSWYLLLCHTYLRCVCITHEEQA